MADPGSLSDIIDVTITLADAEVQRDGFSGVMLVSEHVINSPDRVITYTGKKADVLAAMIVDGFVAGDPAYVQARAVMSQRPSIATIKIGRKDAGDASWTEALDAIRVEDSDWYGLACDTRVKAEIIEIAEWCGSSGEGQFVLVFSSTRPTRMLSCSCPARPTVQVGVERRREE